MIDKTDIDTRFTYHVPRAKQSELYEEIRNKAHDVAQYANENVPDSREKSLALTKLEEFVFWANAAIARNYI